MMTRQVKLSAKMFAVMRVLEEGECPALTMEDVAEQLNITNTGALRILEELFRRQHLTKLRVMVSPLRISQTQGSVVGLPEYEMVPTPMRETRWFVPDRADEAVSFKRGQDNATREQFNTYLEKLYGLKS